MLYRVLTLLFLVGILNSSIQGQIETEVEAPSAAIAPASEITAELVESRRKAAEASTELDEEGKKRAADLYRQAAEQTQRAAAFAAKTVELTARAEKAGDRVKELKTQSDALPPLLADANSRLEQLNNQLKNARFVPAEELSQLQQERLTRESELKLLKDELTKIEAASTNRASRLKDARSRLAAIEKEVADVEQQLAVPPAVDENAALTQAKKTELLARKQTLKKETPALEAEIKAYDAEAVVERVRIERDLRTQQVAIGTSEFQIADLRVKRKQDAAAREQVRTARDDVEEFSSSPILKPLADRNFELSEQNQRVLDELKTKEKDLKLLKTKLADVKGRFESAGLKVDKVGLPASVGALLRNQRTNLPPTRSHAASVHERQPKIEIAQLLLFDLEDERKQLADQDKMLNQYLAQEEFADIPESEIEAARATARVLLARRQENLDPLIQNQSTYFDTLTELSFTEEQLIQQSDEFADYIDERVLWIRSGQSLLDEFRSKVVPNTQLASGTDPAAEANPENEVDSAPGYTVDQASVQALVDSFHRLTSPRNWTEAARAFVDDGFRRPGLYLVFLVFFGVLLRFSVPCRRRISEIGAQAKHSAFSQFTPTVKAALLTVCISLSWPALIAFAGWRLSTYPGDNEFVHGLPLGLGLVALGYFSLELFRQICRPLGLSEAHFGWSTTTASQLRRTLRWLSFFGLPIVLLTAIVRADDMAPGRSSLERLFFIAGTILFCMFLARFLHPKRGIFRSHLAAYSSGWASRLRHVWYGAAVASPLFLAGLAFVGYYYTAQQLAWRLYWSIALIAAVTVIHALVSRLLLVHRRRLSIEQARQRRAEATAAAAAGETGTGPAETTLETSMADLRTQTSQTRRLVTTAVVGAAFVGLWLTWSDVVPALGFLEKWPLWTSISQVSELVENETGDVVKVTRDVLDPVTIADLAIGILIAVLTIIAARNLPGLLEISVLQQLPLENSVRYAITTLCSYGISLIGLIVGCNWIGLHWNQVQWMATALTFGLAFGLQEMFANFVAGIIILFERPIRVGDIVTIEEISGVVTRVRIRATTITNWDRKDYVVPNKDFITGRVLNWTLSDQVNRIVLNVGVAYGSDTARAKSLLLKIAHDHPLIVEDPPPIATFEEFGDSSLLLSLRCFIALKDMPGRLEVVDALHTSVDEQFKKARIEIAFPQRDLHIRSPVPALSVEAPTSTALLNKETGSPSTN